MHGYIGFFSVSKVKVSKVKLSSIQAGNWKLDTNIDLLDLFHNPKFDDSMSNRTQVMNFSFFENDRI